MLIEYDPVKREETLRVRGLDFEDAPKVFAEIHVRWKMTERTTEKPDGSCSGN